MNKRALVITAAMLAAASIGCMSASAEEKDPSDHKIALITDTLGTEQFLLQAYDEMGVLAEKYGFEWTSMECSDSTMWNENTQAASNEGYDMILGVGWAAAEPFSAMADEHQDIAYAVIDTVCGNDKVTSIGFNEAEGAYVLGVMIGNAFPDETKFGYICSYQTQATYKYRYAYMEGIKSVIPDAEFMFNYTNSYSDTTLAYEYALQQQAAGCTVIMGGASASSNTGIYQAALELADKGTPIYTTGLSVDQTTEDNPYILGGLLKNTGSCTEIVVESFINGTLEGGSQILGLKENAFGVVYVTTESENYRNADIITDEVIEAGKAVADQIISGELVIEVPEEAAE